MPRVEQTLASYLSPNTASSLKAPTLPSKPLRTTSALVGKGYQEARKQAAAFQRYPPRHSLAQGAAGQEHPKQCTSSSYQASQKQSLSSHKKNSTSRAPPQWKLLPNVSAWVLHTVKRGYRIQFGTPPPPFNGVFPTLVGPEQGLAMEQEVDTLLRKEAIEVVPPHVRESGFYGRYFIVPKKDGGLRPVLDLRQVNRSVMRLKFKMLTVKQVVSQIRSEDWFVTIDLKDTYFHISILPLNTGSSKGLLSGRSIPISGSSVRPSTLTPHFHEVCGCSSGSSVTPGHPHTQLYRRLVDIRAVGGSTPRCYSHPHERAGVETEHQEKCAFSIIKNHLFGRGVAFNHDAGTFVTCSDRFDPHCSRKSETRPVTHCQAVSTTSGSDGSCVQRDIFWPAVHETFTVVAQDQGVLPEGKPVSHDQGHVAMPMCLGHVEKADASLTGRGAVMSGHPAHGLWSGHRLTCHINCLEMLAVLRALKHFLPDLRDRHVLVCTNSTAVVYYINHQGGLRSRPLYKLAHQILVWSQGKLISLRAIHIPGHLNLGADILSRQGPRPGEWMLYPVVVKQIWRVCGQAQVDLFVTQETSQCPLLYSLTHPAPLGLDAMVQMWPKLSLYAFSPFRLPNALVQGVL
ncbi:hypothetical protein M9458_035380, partial [Cirrhinus mrigala]